MIGPRPVPPPPVLEAFGVAGGRVEPLPGGEEVSVVVEGLVLKRIDDEVVAGWAQSVLAEVEAGAMRVPRPVRADAGRWVVERWIATEFVESLASVPEEPGVVVAVGEALSEALGPPTPQAVAAVGRRSDRWARADRSVWGKESLEPGSAGMREVEAVLRAMFGRPTDAEADLIHGDLTGNVFVDPAGTPVVLDFTPYVRPRRYASAIVVADHLLWHDGSADLLGLLDGDVDGLARALLFRLMAEDLASTPRHGARVTDYQRAIARLGWS